MRITRTPVSSPRKRSTSEIIYTSYIHTLCFVKHELILVILAQQHQHTFRNYMHIQLSLYLYFYLLYLVLNGCDGNDVKQGVFLSTLLVAVKRAGCVVCWLWKEQVLVKQMFKVMSFCLMLARNRFALSHAMGNIVANLLLSPTIIGFLKSLPMLCVRREWHVFGSQCMLAPNSLWTVMAALDVVSGSWHSCHQHRIIRRRRSLQTKASSSKSLPTTDVFAVWFINGATPMKIGHPTILGAQEDHFFVQKFRLCHLRTAAAQKRGGISMLLSHLRLYKFGFGTFWVIGSHSLTWNYGAFRRFSMTTFASDVNTVTVENW